MRKRTYSNPDYSKIRIYDHGSWVERNAFLQSGIAWNISGEVGFKTYHYPQDFLLSEKQGFNFSCCHSKSLAYLSVLYISHGYQILSVEIYSWGQVLKHFIVSLFRSSLNRTCNVLLDLKVSSWKYLGQKGHKSKLHWRDRCSSVSGADLVDTMVSFLRDEHSDYRLTGYYCLFGCLLASLKKQWRKRKNKCIR